MIIKLKAIVALILGYPVMYKIRVKNGEVYVLAEGSGVIFDCVFDQCDTSSIQIRVG